MSSYEDKSKQGKDIAQLEMQFTQDPNSLVFVDLVDAYLEKGRMVEAMVMARRGIKSHPKEGYLALARVYMKQAKFAKGIEALNEVIKIDANNADAYFMKGNLHLKLNENEAAIEALKKAYELNPSNLEAKALLLEKGVNLTPPSVISEEVGEEETDRITTKKPSSLGKPGVKKKSVSPYPKKVPPPPPPDKPLDAGQEGAQVPKEMEAQETTESIDVREKKRVTKLPPPTPEDFAAGDDILKKEQAKKTLMLIVVLGIISATIIGFIAYTANKAKKVKNLTNIAVENIKLDTYWGYLEAKKALESVIKLEDSGSFKATLGYVEAILFGEYGGDANIVKAATEHINDAIQKKDNSATLIAAQMLMKIYGGDANSAIQLGKEEVMKGNQHSRLLWALAIGLLKVGNYEEAVEFTKKAHLSETGNDPKAKDPRSYKIMGDISYKQGYMAQALGQYELALKDNSQHTGSLLGKALVLSSDPSKYGEAMQIVEDVLKLKSENKLSTREESIATFIKGVIYYNKGSTKEGEDLLNASLALDKDNPLIHFELAKIYASAGNVEKAISSFDNAIKLDPKNPTYYIKKGEFLISKEKYDEAISTLKRAANLMQEKDRGEAYVLIARALRKKGSLDDALKEASKALGINPEDPFAHMEKGQVYLARQDEQRAIEEFELALSGFKSMRNKKAVVELAISLGKMYKKNKNNERAEEMFKNAVETDPKMGAEGFFQLGLLYKENRAPKEAVVEMFQKYLEQEPTGQFAQKAKELMK
ncbi:MAG: tetratricopeptide repeat protein [Deltaproteobacteria bacterium]|nr:tetratricopeptide repeat protein [Deltaproteobacteria bacterium]